MTSGIIKIYVLDDIIDIKEYNKSQTYRKGNGFPALFTDRTLYRYYMLQFFPVPSVVLPYIGELRKRNPLKKYVPVSFIIGLQLGKGMVY